MAPTISLKTFAPETLFDEGKFVQRVDRYFRNAATRDLRYLFNATTTGWKVRPRFFSKTGRSSYSMFLEIYTKNKTYGLVNAGSPPHPIRVRRKKFLSFQPGYRAATTPRIIGSRAPMRWGDYVHPVAVSHPGFIAREFDEEIAKKYEPEFRKEIQHLITMK